MKPPWQESWWASIRPVERELWRGVEAQHVVATMRLVDSLQEQEMLESILEASKPPLPEDGSRSHYLLVTPFRYRSPTASRFRRAGDVGVWYGAEELATACTELAYWRWRFLLDSAGLADSEIVTELTFFKAMVSGESIDLSAPPWDANLALWSDPVAYEPCQALAQACRERGDVQWIRYGSARKVEGHCAAVLYPNCLRTLDLVGQQTWVYKITRGRVLMAHGSDRLELSFNGAQ